LALVDVLIPTYRRKIGLAIVLTSLPGQTHRTTTRAVFCPW